MIYGDISVEGKKTKLNMLWRLHIILLHHSNLFPVSLYSNVYMVKKIHHLYLPYVITIPWDSYVKDQVSEYNITCNIV